MKLRNICLTLAALVLLATPSAFAQTPPQFVGVFHTVLAYTPPPTNIVVGSTSGTNSGYHGWGDTPSSDGTKHKWGGVESEVDGVVFAVGAQDLPTNVGCTLESNVVDRDNNPVSSPDGTGVYSCVAYSNPASGGGYPPVQDVVLGGCSTTEHIWTTSAATQGACYTNGSICINFRTPNDGSILVLPDAQGCTHYTAIKGINDGGGFAHCCQIPNDCIAGNNCVHPPNTGFCQTVC